MTGEAEERAGGSQGPLRERSSPLAVVRAQSVESAGQGGEQGPSPEDAAPRVLQTAG